jgi:hypothetical protein
MTHAIVIRPRARGFARRAAAAALATLLFVSVPALAGPAAQEAPEARAAIDAMKNDFETIGDQTRDDPAAQIDAFEVGPPAADEAGRVHQLMRTFMNSMLQVRNGYLAELDAMGWSNILDANRLKADTGLVESRRMIAQARAAGLSAVADSETAYNGFEALVQGADLEPKTKRDIIAGFNQNKARGLAEMRGTFALESQTLDQFEAMVELLGRTEWVVEESQIAFQQDADVETFNGHFARINELTAQLQARQQANVQRAQDRLEGSGR